MPQLQGEVSLLTLFADVHYYFGPPTAVPPHDRFDKTSYVYLYHDAINKRGRIEIANNPGTPNQDAFTGYLDTVRIVRSHKHPTLFAVTVDGAQQANGQASPPPQDVSQWHLPTFDPRNEAKYMYRLHTVDIYFWTAEDSEMFLDSLRRFLQEPQLHILDAPVPHAEHRDTMSPVVQKLEQVAIAKPYHGRSPSISTTNSYAGPPTTGTPQSNAAGNLPPPPPLQQPQPQQAQLQPQQEQQQQRQQQQPVEVPGSFAPVAYNPAAPAAPEPIAHRDKTPPPPDAADGTGLANSYKNDQNSQVPAQSQHPGAFSQSQPYQPGISQPQRTGSFPPAPPAQGTPPAQGIQRTDTGHSAHQPPPQQGPGTPSQYPGQQQAQPSAPQNVGTPVYGQGQYDQHQQQYGQQQQPYGQQQQQYSQPQATQYANYPQSPGHAPMQSPALQPGAQMQPSGYPQQGYSNMQSPPPGGYAQYNYGQNQTPGADQQNVHQVAYKPTEQEHGAHSKPPTGQPGPGQQPGKLESHAGRLEKGVGKFLKKLDKKF